MEELHGVEVVRVEKEKKYEYDRVVDFSIGLVENADEGAGPSPERKEEKEEGGSEGVEEGATAATEEVRAEPTFIPLVEGLKKEEGKDEGAEEEPPLEEARRDDQSLKDFSVPWEASCHQIYSPLLRLHQEIMEFTEFLQPTPDERKMRHDAIARVKETIHSLWPHARVEVFGSYETGLYLPTSDIDMVILQSNCVDIPFALRKIAGNVSRRGIAKNLLVLSKARIPIVKFEDVETNLKFDISFDVDGGPEAALFIKDMIRKIPLIRPLVYILKIFLQQRDLNEVYSGGVGSYGLIIMVTVFLMTHESRIDKRERRRITGGEKNLGILLIDFFDLYGNILDMFGVGISCRKGGFFYDKRSYDFFNVERPYLLSIEDPLQRDQDVGKNSFNIQKVKSAFQFAHQVLTAPETQAGELVLMRIIRMDGLLIRRLDKLEESSPGEPAGETGLGDSPKHEGAETPKLTRKEKMGIMGVAISVSSSEEGALSDDSDDVEVVQQNPKRSRTR
ncbi:nucleotidyltransferase domain-containing protein [Chloropicon primus]|uniref:polynucleotide adenylyltransferase n=2 Tax=Chloropicon primus TaxID=1764295 RepID=A0A5B8MFL0_9CHLO|nr:nucleotidyltransferase domain-containing protein [Chloropicon primus]UPQ98482.1 nucleotidyltransferase domain-containing protein [Chloropicon primus]|eukprot:QDZ19273.1 nucleotidyltransferase domain-containing protein [Chloropicon primus]